MCLIVCFTALLGTVSLFCHEAESAATPFVSLKPSNPSFVKERDNITLKWNYTLDGSILFAKFSNVTGGSSTRIAFKSGAGDVNVGASFQERFMVDISNSSTQVTILTVQRSDHGSYELEINTMGGDVGETVELIVQFESSLTSYSGDQTVSEGSNRALFCDATGKPTPNITWTRVWENGTDGEDVFFGNPWDIVNISRTAAGTYRCTAYNGIGNPVSHSLYVNVTYKPDKVILVSNTTENKDCSDLWVNFTCISSEANPPVYNYLLSDGENGSSFSKSGIWIKKISRGGKSIYNCLAYQLVGNVTSTNSITLTVNVPLAMEQAENKTVQEGDNVELSCNVTGIPDPTVIWTKARGGGYNAIEGKLLNITNINRAQAGEYRCTANNTCGEESTVANIDVQYQPENVSLTTNTTSKNVCTGIIINFTCTAEANPAVHTYLLYENDTLIENMGISGTWIKTIENAGQVVFRCEVNNSVQGIGKSGNTILTVDDSASVVRVDKSSNTVIEGDTFSLSCEVSGDPTPNVTWIKVSNDERSNGNILNFINITRDDTGDYRCETENRCGKEIRNESINVFYPADITHISRNQTVNETDVVTLNCSAEGIPSPNITWTRVSDNSSVSFPLTITGKQDEGGYRCTADNGIGNPASQDVYIIVENYRPIDTNLNTSLVGKSVAVNTSFNVTCSAQANPPAKYRFYKDQDNFVNDTTGSDVSVITTSVSERIKQVDYSCTPFNDFGDGPTDGFSLTVLYAASVINPGNESFNETLGEEVNFLCLGMGNPAPTVNWTSTDGVVNWISNLTNVTFTAKPDSSGSYLCTIKNELGEAFKRFNLVVEAENILTKLTVTNKNCDDNPSEICKNISKTVKERIEGDDGLKGRLENVEEKNCECGSVTVYLSLEFTQSVKIPEVLSVLKKAADGNGFGELKVNPGSIQAISDDQLPTDSSTQGPPSTVGTTTSDGDKDEDLWIIIGASVGGAIVLAVVIAVVAWCVHHKRKCRRKGSKVRCSESEGQAFAPREETPYSEVNNGYADAGPRPTVMVDMSQHQGASGPAAAPDYAVVDKSAKKGKKKDKKVEEQKPQAEPPQYAAVDKSKKKKKEEPEATYAQVDTSKKSKKKPKAGEVLYADLGDFHQMKELPAVSTSPQALPPIKKPAPYVETQYADITQFLKGDATLPDSNNSQGPATGTQNAPVPKSNNSQEPATSTKEESQASKTGGDGGPGHNTNF